MDKQIIIDGVDVSGCCYYSEGKCLGCYALDEKDCISCYGICKEINDCYYKLYKRKEQECEKLDNEAQNLFTEKTNLEIELNELKEELAISIHLHESDKILLKSKEQECEELKLDLIEVKAHSDYLNNLALSETLNLVSEQLDQLKAENEWVKSHFKQIDETNKILYQEKCELLSKLDGWDEVYKEVNDIAYVISLKMNKYKQALKEIKEIVETCNSGINCSECPYTEECRTDIEAESLGICKLIQQKCEVLDE